MRDSFDAEDDRGLQDHHQLLQSMIAFSQLWSYIWDCFFSPRASQKQDDWEDLELTDTRIMLAYRRLPSTLHWSSENVFNYVTEESERHVRRRILVFLVSLVGNYQNMNILICMTEIFFPSFEHSASYFGI